MLCGVVAMKRSPTHIESSAAGKWSWDDKKSESSTCWLNSPCYSSIFTRASKRIICRFKIRGIMSTIIQFLRTSNRCPSMGVSLQANNDEDVLFLTSQTRIIICKREGAVNPLGRPRTILSMLSYVHTHGRVFGCLLKPEMA
jgi:hypothetical protein